MLRVDLPHCHCQVFVSLTILNLIQLSREAFTLTSVRVLFPSTHPLNVRYEARFPILLFPPNIKTYLVLFTKLNVILAGYRILGRKPFFAECRVSLCSLKSGWRMGILEFVHESFLGSPFHVASNFEREAKSQVRVGTPVSVFASSCVPCSFCCFANFFFSESQTK